MVTEQKLKLYQLSQPQRYFISEGLLLENPNQAIKFLKEKNLDPQSSQEGKRILDSINNITRGDGYTNMLTKFHVNEKMPLDDLKKLHQYLKQNKQHVNRLPKPVVTYDNYRELRRDLDDMEGMRNLKKLYNELPSHLKSQADQLDARSKEQMKKLAESFLKLKPEQQKFFTSKIRGYENINEFINSLDAYITQIESGDDYDTIKNKIESTSNAHLTYADPEKNILIAHINSYDASKTLGCTSQWCIARDPSYWRSYKKGGNKYFYMWDFNYPVNDNRYMVATAYRPESPEHSTTHLKDDKQTNLDRIINNKGLSYDIFNDYLKKHKEEYLKSLENSTGLLKALRDFSLNSEGSQQELLEVISKSNFVEEYSSPDDIDISGNYIYFEMTPDQMKDALDLGDEYDHVSSIANSYSYNDYGYSDSDDANYMYGGLNGDNLNKIKEIAEKLGVPKDEREKFDSEEGKIKEFLEKNEMENVIDEYVSQYGIAQSDAKQREAKEQIDQIPFNIEDGSISIDGILEYMKENELQFDTFDEFVEDVRDNIDISSDAIYSARYDDLDLDNLNSEIGDVLDNILIDMESPDSKYFANVEAVKELKKTLERFGFEFVDSGDVIASRQQKDKTINILDYGYPQGNNEYGFEDIEEDDKLNILVLLEYPNSDKTRSGWIPLSSLKNHIDQPELQGMNEWIRKYKKLI